MLACCYSNVVSVLVTKFLIPLACGLHWARKEYRYWINITIKQSPIKLITFVLNLSIIHVLNYVVVAKKYQWLNYLVNLYKKGKIL